MSQTTPDIRQLSTCCGKPLVWRDYVTFDGRYSADCSGCGADLCVEAMEQARELTATEKLLLARIAELEATLANERGEGEAPCEGWVYSQRSGRWRAPHGIVAKLSPERVKNEGWEAPYAWERWDTPEVQRGCADSFRAAMRAASSQGAVVPKEGAE